MDDAQLDDIISRLLEVRHSRAGKPVQLTEAEIRALCITARDIFMQQVRRGVVSAHRRPAPVIDRELRRIAQRDAALL